MSKYKFTDIDELAGWLYVDALNDKDQMTGHREGARAFLYDPDAGLKDLPLPITSQNEPVAINAHGHVVGWTWAAGGDLVDQHAFLYDGHKAVDLAQSLKHLNYTDGAAAVSINDADDIVGWGRRKGSPEVFGWLLRKGKEAIDLKDTTGHHLEPYQINNVGRIIGRTVDGAAFWHDAGTKHVTKVQAAGFRAINDKQQIAGVSTEGNAILYEEGAIKQLSDGPASPTAINNDGMIVGNTADGTGPAFVYDLQKPEEGLVDLAGLVSGDLGEGRLYATALNNKGNIIGHIRHDAHGHVLSLLLKPIPDGTVYPDHEWSGPDLSRIAAAVEILFGVVNDAPGLVRVGARPGHVGPGPDDPVGPLGRASANVSSAEGDILVGLGLRKLGSLVRSAAERVEIQRVATRLVGAAAARMAGGPRPSPSLARPSVALGPIERLRELQQRRGG